MSYNANYENDARVRAKNKWYDAHDDKRLILFVKLWDDDEEFEATFPFRWDVCSTCQGKGSHVNPSIDCDGLSAKDFAEDPDFAEQYWGGAYDQPCNGCGGRTTERVLDEDRFNDQHREWYALLEEYWRDEAEYRAECEAERRMGA